MTQKTTEIAVGDQKVDVAALPKEIRESIDFFDQIGADMIEIQSKIAQLQYEHNVWFVAANGMKNRIVTDTEEWIKANAPEGEESKPVEEAETGDE